MDGQEDSLTYVKDGGESGESWQPGIEFPDGESRSERIISLVVQHEAHLGLAWAIPFDEGVQLSADTAQTEQGCRVKMLEDRGLELDREGQKRRCRSSHGGTKACPAGEVVSLRGRW